MRILLIGASGDIGQVIQDEFSSRHDIIKVGRSSGDIIADITDRASIEVMYKEAGKVDAVISANGNVHFAPLDEFTEEQFRTSLLDKAMSQINLVLVGLNHIADGGSFYIDQRHSLSRPDQNWCRRSDSQRGARWVREKCHN